MDADGVVAAVDPGGSLPGGEPGVERQTGRGAVGVVPVELVAAAELEPGDDFEEELPGRTLTGTLVFARVVVIQAGELVGIVDGATIFSRSPSGPWLREAEPPMTAST